MLVISAEVGWGLPQEWNPDIDDGRLQNLLTSGAIDSDRYAYETDNAEIGHQVQVTLGVGMMF